MSLDTAATAPSERAPRADPRRQMVEASCSVAPVKNHDLEILFEKRSLYSPQQEIHVNPVPLEAPHPRDETWRGAAEFSDNILRLPWTMPSLSHPFSLRYEPSVVEEC